MTSKADVVREAIRFIVEADLVGDGMDLDGDLGFDSLHRFELLTTLEERLDLSPPVSDAEWGALKTVGDVIRFVEGRAP